MVNTVNIAGKIKIRYFIAISLDTAGFVPGMIWATGFHRQTNILNRTITKTFLVFDQINQVDKIILIACHFA